MLTPKPCKWCGSVWHSKNKCKEAPNRPLKAPQMRKGAKVPLTTQNVSERPTLAYKGISDRSQLIGYADKYFSVYVRTRGGDGITNTCFTCDKRLSYDELQCGHFMPRRYFNTRWHTLNCWPQCNDCNVTKGGNLEVYERRLRAKYGNTAIDSLMLLAQSSDKVSAFEIESVIERYKGVVF
jgi:hypothetical protein